MRRNDMKSGAVVEIIREILSWNSFDDVDKVYMVQSFLLGWTDTERIHALTNSEKEKAQCE